VRGNKLSYNVIQIGLLEVGEGICMCYKLQECLETHEHEAAHEHEASFWNGARGVHWKVKKTGV
jgi:hypothetical protein